MTRFRTLGAAALGAAALLLSACTDNPVDGGEAHPEASGLSLSLAGAEIYRVVNAEATCPGGPCADAFTFAPGAEIGPYAITFLDEDGDPIPDDEMEEGVSLGFDVEDASVVQAESLAPWQFRLEAGAAAGTSGLRLQLLHNGHADFSTPPFDDPNGIVVRVAP